MTRIAALLVILAAITGCKTTDHQQYDFGRATMAAYTLQTDLTRPSVADAQHSLSGNEAAAIRLRQAEAATNEETGDSVLTQGNN